MNHHSDGTKNLSLREFFQPARMNKLFFSAITIYLNNILEAVIMELSNLVKNQEEDFKEVFRRDFEAIFIKETNERDLIVSKPNSYTWNKDVSFIKIEKKGSILGYIFPFQKTAYIFINTAE